MSQMRRCMLLTTLRALIFFKRVPTQCPRRCLITCSLELRSFVDNPRRDHVFMVASRTRLISGFRSRHTAKVKYGELCNSTAQGTRTRCSTDSHYGLPYPRDANWPRSSPYYDYGELLYIIVLPSGVVLYSLRDGYLRRPLPSHACHDVHQPLAAHQIAAVKHYRVRMC